MNDFGWGFIAGIFAVLLICVLVMIWIVKTEPEEDKVDPRAHIRDLELGDTRAQLNMIEKRWHEDRMLHQANIDSLQADLHDLREQYRVTSVIDEIIDKHTVSED